MSAVKRGKLKTPETRARMSAAQKGRLVSAETRQKLKEGQARAAQEGRLKCPPECLCGRHKKDTPERASLRREVMLGKNVGKKYGGQRNRERWLAGVYNGTTIRGKPGYHAGVWMRCLNSEGVFARDLDGAKIIWQYEPRRFRLSWCTYLPDFYLPEFDIWVEVKGKPGQPGKWKDKVDTFRRETGKMLVVVFQNELSSLLYKEGD